MRCYAVFFDPNVADDFRQRADALCKVAGLPSEVVQEKVDSTNGRTFGIYITEETAKRFPQFESEFGGGEWLDCP
jgi:hypothetical protein